MDETVIPKMIDHDAELVITCAKLLYNDLDRYATYTSGRVAPHAAGCAPLTPLSAVPSSQHGDENANWFPHLLYGQRL
jgi:hypothetical protein